MLKPIFNAVVVAVAAAIFCIGCGDKGTDPNNPSGGGGLVGDWLLEAAWRVHSNGSDSADNNFNLEKAIVSFKASGDIVSTEFTIIANFAIEHGESEGMKYRVKGDSLYTFSDEYEEGVKYRISGNTLIIESARQWCREGDDDECESVWIETYYAKYVRQDIADFRKSLGTVYSQDVALKYGEWGRPSNTEDERDVISFGNAYREYVRIGNKRGARGDRGDIYASADAWGAEWYTENANLFLLEVECSERVTIYGVDGDDEPYEYQRCISLSVRETVPLDYELDNGTLRLRPAGSTEWDVWTGGQRKSRLEKDKRPANPLFKAFRR